MKSVKVEAIDELALKTPPKKSSSKCVFYLCVFHLLRSDPDDIRVVRSIQMEDSEEEAP
jgi:hypothetical protein